MCGPVGLRSSITTATPVRPPLPGRSCMTAGQLADVIAQESARPIGSIELDPFLDDLGEGGRVVIGSGRYDTVLGCGEIDGVACVTFTGRTPMADTPFTTPAADYLSMVAAGLRAAHGLDDTAVVEYLRHRPGVVGHLSAESLHAAIALHDAYNPPGGRSGNPPGGRSGNPPGGRSGNPPGGEVWQSARREVWR